MLMFFRRQFPELSNFICSDEIPQALSTTNLQLIADTFACQPVQVML